MGEDSKVPPKKLGDTALRFEPPPADSPVEDTPKAPPRPRTPAATTPFAPAAPTVASTPLRAEPPKRVTPPRQGTPVEPGTAPEPAVPPQAAPAKKAARKAPAKKAPATGKAPAEQGPAATKAPATGKAPAAQGPAATKAPATGKPPAEERPADRDAPAEVIPAAPTAPAAETPANEAPAPEASSAEAPAEQAAPARKAVAKKVPAKKAAPAKKAPAKKAAAKTAVTKATKAAATAPEPEPIIEPARATRSSSPAQPVSPAPAEATPTEAEATPATVGATHAEVTPVAARGPVETREPAPAGEPARFAEDEGINPAYLPEALALAAVQKLGPAARRRVAWYRLTYPTADRDAVSRAITHEFVRRARRQGFAAGLVGPAGLVVEAAGVAWLQARLVLHLAAAYGHDPEDRRRAAELLVLQRVHGSVETAEAAVLAAERTSSRRASRRVGAERLTGPLARAVGAGILRAAATRIARRFVPGAGLIVGSVTAARSTERLAARAVRYYRGFQERGVEDAAP